MPRKSVIITRMRKALTTTVPLVALLATLTACSSSGATHGSAAPTRSGAAFNTARYLYGLDGDTHSRAQVDALLARLGARCTDNLGVLAAAATNTAVNVTDAHGTQTTYGVLAGLAGGLPASGRVNCQNRLSGVEKALKAQR